MSSSKSFSIRKDLPTLITAKARGYFDYKEVKVFDDEISYNINMTEYDRLNYVINSSDLNPKSITFNALTLPNYTYADGETKVLMPYDDGKVYHNTNVQEKNVFFENVGCEISEENTLAGFSTTSYAQVTKTFPDTFTSFKMIFKATTGSSVTSHHNCVFGNSGSSNISVIIRSTGVFSYYTGSWTTGTTTLSPNTTYWFCVNYTDGTFVGYILSDNGSYTLDTLPDLSEWSEEWISTVNIFAGNVFNIGYNKNSTSEFFTGTFDLNNCKIWVDGEDFWYYNMITEVSQDLKGCLYNYTDTGAAATLNCFYYNNTYVISDDENIAGGLYLGQVSVPAHDLYTYSETPYQVYDNFTVMGTSLNIDQESGKVSGFSSSSYLDTGYIPNLSANTPWKMRVRFKYSLTGASQYYMSSTSYTSGPYFATNSSHYLDCGISSNGTLVASVVSTFVLEDGINYVLEWNYDGNQTYTLRCQREDNNWQDVGTITYNSPVTFIAALRLGASTNGYCRGVIDLSTDTYFEIDGVKTWIPTTTHYNTTWEKQS